MRFFRYGVELERLERKHLETVRQWRNQERIRLCMQFQNEISPASQADWFNALHPNNDWYFLAHAGTIPFGLFHIKQVRWDGKTGEAGGFVGRPEWIGGAEAATAILALMDFAFFQLGLEFLEVTYRPNDSNLEALNRQLGYELLQQQENGFVRARVSAARFLAATKAVRKAAELHSLRN
jgi:hypothetical protein